MIDDTTNLQEGYGVVKQYSIQIMMYYPLKSYLDVIWYQPLASGACNHSIAMIGRNSTWGDESTKMGLIISFQNYMQIH